MNKKIKVEIMLNNTIQLPDNIVKELSLKEGKFVSLEWNTRLKDKCFFIQEENEESVKEEYYCIPKWIFEKCHIPLKSVQLIHDEGQLTITTSDKVIESLGVELIGALYEQGVDFSLLADDIVDYINEGLKNESEI